MNPGHLPNNLNIANLKQIHSSFPANPLIAEPLYFAGYIEKIGTGIPDMLEQSVKAGLKESDFMQEDVFKTIIWRKTEQATPQATRQVTRQVPEGIRRIILVIDGDDKRADMQSKLELKDREHFLDNYLNPAIKDGYIEMAYPDNPKHPKHTYHLTAKGLKLKKSIQNKKKI